MNKDTLVDQSFDDIANKFERNIYGTSKGRLRHELLIHHLTEQLTLDSNCLTVLDAGGGTGAMSQEMAKLGHEVTLSDLSSETLEIAKSKLADFKNVGFLHSDIQSLPDGKAYDLVICHAVLEWLSQPLELLPKLISLVKPGGYLSLSFFNQDAFKFGNLLYGNFDYVEQGLKKSNQVRLNPKQPLVPKKVIDALQEHRVEIIFKSGIRCFHDYLLNRDMQKSHFAQLKQMEIKYGQQEPYLWLGKYFYLIVKRLS